MCGCIYAHYASQGYPTPFSTPPAGTVPTNLLQNYGLFSGGLAATTRLSNGVQRQANTFHNFYTQQTASMLQQANRRNPWYQ